MPVAPDLGALKRRIDRYLWANRTAEMAALLDVLTRHFIEFDRVAVIGGLVRDFAREGRSGFRSDVDLVVDASSAFVDKLATNLGARQNRFGGYGFGHGPWKIDFWALETTWAARNAGIAIDKLENVIDCTFFDWDAVAYDLWARQLICHRDYLDKIKSGALDINLRHTPSPDGNLLRAIRRVVLWNLQVGPGLRSFMEETLTEKMLRSIQIYETRKYGISISGMWDSARCALDYLLDFDGRAADQVQLNLHYRHTQDAYSQGTGDHGGRVPSSSSVAAAGRRGHRRRRSPTP